MRKLSALLIFLISSLAITGISFIDGKIWDVIFIIVGLISYSVVGLLFSIGVLHGKQAGKDAYALIFFLLILGGYAVYKGLIKLKLWILSWSLFLKILVPSIIGLIIVGLIILLCLKGRKNNNV